MLMHCLGLWLLTLMKFGQLSIAVREHAHVAQQTQMRPQISYTAGRHGHSMSTISLSLTRQR